ncbi:GIY-YIG nuclease family protein [Actinomadura opuntiae]|uniref:GIY-YIG nuclease family protein n=1 Tax=Actinomadura sp. OS1-43 TaxID=604315 RepID=UPI00255A91CA|nr:GIY-YIG nuclease family protein [Actinomadura sp. OS1-43]MDL4812740.1 GIY-YIG nuclease family protein [Actinomadura sp. OS1-43]
MNAGHPPNPPRRTALYRLYDANGLLLYVGIAYDPGARFYQHSREKPWWPEVARKTVTWLGDRETAERAEVTAVRGEAPKYNRSGVERPEPAPVIADDGVQDVPATIARPLLTRLIEQTREDDLVSALTVRGRRRVYLVTPDFYERAVKALDAEA